MTKKAPANARGKAAAAKPAAAKAAVAKPKSGARGRKQTAEQVGCRKSQQQVADSWGHVPASSYI